METRFCAYCDAEAVDTVKVSVESYADEERPVCATCREAYEVGVQHGMFRKERGFAGPVTKTKERR